jgi:Protein of unknown function (DUF3995)
LAGAGADDRLGRVTTTRVVSVAGSVVLAGLSALHVSWACGSSWPAPDRTELAAVVAGTDQVPSARACLEVAGVLAAAAALVGGAGGRRPAAQVARLAVAGGFLARGAAGVSGATGRLVPWQPAPRFARLDRRYYGPLCLAIAASALASLCPPG